MEGDDASLVQPFELLSLATQPSAVPSFIGTRPTINSIPMEVLHRIFSIACDDEYKVEIKPRACPFQHILMCVCRFWYSTGRSHYGSISRLSVTYLDSSYYRAECGYSFDTTISSRHIQFLRIALKHCRSQFHSTIYVRSDERADSPGVPQGVVDILTEVVSSSDRWLSLDVDLDIPLQFLLPIHNCIPHLQSLVLRQRHNTAVTVETRESLSLLFKKAPSLTHVETDIEEFGYQLPWGQLQELTVSPQWDTGESEPDDFDVMAYVATAVIKSTRLKRFTCVRPDSLNGGPDTIPTLITHPTLHEFCLVEPDAFLLQHLELPALDTLVFHFREELHRSSYINQFINGFLGFTERSNCGSNIHSLSLTHSRPADLLPMIHTVLPNLIHLQVRLFSFNPVFDFLNLLRAPDFFPDLEELDISLEMDAARITDLAISAMLTRLMTVVSTPSRHNVKHVIFSIDGQIGPLRISSLLDFAVFKTQSPVLVSLKELKTPMIDVHAAYWTVENEIQKSYKLLTSELDGLGHWPKRVSFTNDEASVVLYRTCSRLPHHERNQMITS